MIEYVHIKSGATTARMLNRDKNNYVDLKRVDEGESPPGDGWYPVEKILPKPTPGPGQLLGYTYTIENGVAEKRYFVEAQTPDQPSPRTFRRSYLAQWIRASGKWEVFSAFLERPETADLKFMWEYCTEFDEDNEMWGQAVQTLKAVMGLSDAEVESMLRYGETGQAEQAEVTE